MLLSMSNHYQTRAPRRQNGTGWTLTTQSWEARNGIGHRQISFGDA